MTTSIGEPDRAARKARCDRFDRFFAPVIFIAVLLSLITVFDADLSPVEIGFDVAVWLVFVAEFAIRFWILRSDYWRDKWNYFDIGLIVFTFPAGIIPGLAGLRVLRLARFARFLRLGFVAAKLAREARRLFTFRNLHVISAFVVITIFICALIAFSVERETFDSFDDALWWSVVTLTTVGYGDFTPESGFVRIAGVVLMVSGLLFLGTLAATLSGYFLTHDPEATDKEDDETPLSVIGRLDAIDTKLETLSTGVSVADEIRKFAQLHDDGLITSDEFEARKRSLL